MHDFCFIVDPRTRPALRTVVRMVQAGLAFDRIFHKLPGEIIQENFPMEVARLLRVCTYQCATITLT